MSRANGFGPAGFLAREDRRSLWLRPALLAWLAVVVLATFPWTSLTSHPHWGRVRWVPFTDIVKPQDLLANLVLYFPLGVLVAGRSASGPRVALQAALAAVLVSSATEAAQVYSHGRWASLTDVVTNVLGAMAGLTWARGRRAWRHARQGRNRRETNAC